VGGFGGWRGGDTVHEAPPSDLVVTVAAHRSTTPLAEEVLQMSWPEVVMLDSSANQDGCKGASLRLRYTASGRRVDR
jgi:hypothetical protein